MDREASDHQRKIRILEVALIALAIVTAPFSYKALAYDQPRPEMPWVVVARLPIMPLPSAPQAAAQQQVGLPVRLKIPGIRVNAPIRNVGLLPNGSMGIPKVPSETAWYMLGPKPGETGSAVIAGHVNWLYGATGAFQRLASVKPGDKIMVQDDKGSLISFIVREIRTYGASADATDVFSSSDGKAHLNLVTCDGIWDKRARQYTKRLVVFTDREVK